MRLGPRWAVGDEGFSALVPTTGGALTQLNYVIDSDLLGCVSRALRSGNTQPGIIEPL